MKKLITALCLFLFATGLNAQDQTDSIRSKKSLGTYIYFQNDKALRNKQLLEVMNNNQEAYELMKSAKNNSTWAGIFGALGGGLIGWPLGWAIAGGDDPPWYLAGIGAGLIIVGIPFNSKYNRLSKQAVDIYNNSIEARGKTPPELELGMTQNGVGVVLRF